MRAHGAGFAFLLALIVTGGVPSPSLGADSPAEVGRVKITPVSGPGSAAYDSVRAVLQDRLSAKPGEAFPVRRIISIRPRMDDVTLFDATIYDYTVEKAFELVLDAHGEEISRKILGFQPDLAQSELDDAMAIVSAESLWSAGVKNGSYEIYRPMPPITVDKQGRRMVNVGIMNQVGGSHELRENEIVSVHIPTGTIARYGQGAPETSLATSSLLACGPGTSDCGSSGSCATGTTTYQIEWPTPNPVWKVHVRRPSCTDSVQGQGTGLELTDVYYKGKMVFKRAEVPVLNVKYQGDTCGPYRDWLDSEDCFQATGVDTFSGMRVTTGNPLPSTLCESDVDSGNFRGVAIHDQGSSLWLLTETTAGWYRYVMEWRLFLDGSIEPVFGFGATSNNCVCNLHYHHAYWRFEWAIDATSDGTTDNPSTGIATLERRRTGTTDTYDPVPTEAKLTRPAVNPENDWFRVRNPVTGTGWVFQPGLEDGSASGDTYAKGDFWGLALNSGQIDDPNSDTSIGIDGWVNAESLGASKRLVTWYHAGYGHDIAGGDNEPCELVGPRLVRVQGCDGAVGSNNAVLSCGQSVTLTVEDFDLRGAGTVTINAWSAHEPTPETLVMNESPAGSGHFERVVVTTTSAPVAGDGQIAIAHGDAIIARYVDASACGTPNVNVDKSIPIDCAGPALSGVQVTGVTPNAATVSWSSDEASTSVVHYGTTPPGGSSASSSNAVTAHALALSSLLPCTVYYYWVESTDAAGNTTASSASGGYYSFVTAAGGVPTTYSTSVPVAIQDNTTVNSPITVGAASTISDVNVGVNITHSYDGDLVVSLVAPGAGPVVTLVNRRGTGGDNFTNTVFDDEAATAITAGSPPYTGSFRPEGLLSALDGMSSAGTWQLRVADQANIDTGSIVSWSLILTTPSSCTALPAPPPVPDGSYGAEMTASRLDPGGSKLRVLWDTATCPGSNYHIVYGSMAGLATLTTTGGVCGLGPAGDFTWSGPPAGSLWFLVVSDNSNGTEGSWGKTSAGVQRKGTTASGVCGNSVRVNSATCP